MDQYRRIKGDHRGDILFFRLGDFYEMFFEDAIEVSALLNLTLTKRQGYPMCGIPYHASRSYIARLLRAGKRVAICEQITRPGAGKSALMDRAVVEIISPGTTVEEDYLDRGCANYLAALAFNGSFFSFSYLDLSIGDFYSCSFHPSAASIRLRQELERLQIREIIVQESLLNLYPLISSALAERSSLVINRWADWLFDFHRSRERLEKQFTSLKAFGLDNDSPEIISAGVLLEYLDNTSKSLLPHIRSIKINNDGEFLNLDEATQRNLELVKNLMDGESRFTLLEVMDETKTSMGKRLLRNRILHPLNNQEGIGKRLDIVEKLYRKQELLGNLRDLLTGTPDIERLSSRLALDKAHAKDAAAIGNALENFRKIYKKIESLSPYFESQEALSLNEECNKELRDLEDLLKKGIADDPSILLTEGNLIRDSYNSELDRLKELRNSGRKLLENYLEEEKERTGISTLKIRYNRLIGYYFEVSNVNLPRVPSHFIRRQGIAGGERFTTDKLSSLESEINSASDKIIELEKNLFLEIRDKAKSQLVRLSSAAKFIAEADVGASLAWAAAIHGWTRPKIDTSNKSIIKEGRHPVVEAHMGRGEFIPNDLELDRKVFFSLITGPNMAGKSTYLRQAALITIMAQCGSFVPAAEARIGLVDRIYCRVGASDNLARGESTFLVEMNETAYILNTATDKSFVIMDEVGRGTGTKDGFAIAWAVCEDLLENIKCRTLFATHYHELSKIIHPALKNLSMEVAESEGRIIFLHKIKNGPASESYGIHVAALAGLKDNVLFRANEIMSMLNYNEIPIEGFPKAKPSKNETINENIYSKLIKELSGLDINNITPLQAINLIQKWKNLNTNEKKEIDNSPGLFD